MLSKLLDSLWRKDPGAAYSARFASARLAYESGDYELAESEFAALATTRPTSGEAWLYAGLCALKLENAALALGRFVKARELDPRNHEYHYQEAAALATLGSWVEAKAACVRAEALAPGFSLVHVLWAALELPGEDYFTFLRRLHVFLKPATYLEVGVFQGRSLVCIGPETQAIGVDPEPKLAVRVPPKARVVAKTSDDFFAAHDVVAEFGGRRLALGFIDGMHRFEFALRDFINMERVCAVDATILIHDCYPLTRFTAERDLKPGFWSGDIWRLILILKKYRPDLKVHTLALSPTGLGMVRGLDPASTVLSDNYNAIVEELLAVDYEVLGANKAGMLNLFPNDWDAIVKLLD